MRYLTWISAALGLSMAASCNDAAGPAPRIVTLSFCEYTGWVGIQNDGEAWKTLSAGPGTVSVRATERVVIGRTFAPVSSPATLELFYLTREQAEATFKCGDGTGELSGTVTGLSTYTTVAVGTRLDGVTPDAPQFTLTNVAASPVDLVAVQGRAAIVRHGMTYTNGGTIAPVDFSSAEAFGLQSNTVTLPTGAGSVFWSNHLVTARGTRSQLQTRYASCCVADSLLGVPVSRLQAGDLHDLEVRAVIGSGDVRVSERFYAAAGDQSVAFGPAATPATVTMVRADGGGAFFRVDVPVQREYDGQIQVFVTGGTTINSATRWVIYASSEYRAASTTWSFTVPDMGVTTMPQGPPDPTQVASWPKQARLGYEFSSHDGDVYQSALATRTIP